MLYHKLHWGATGGPEFLLGGPRPPLAPHGTAPEWRHLATSKNDQIAQMKATQ